MFGIRLTRTQQRHVVRAQAVALGLAVIGIFYVANTWYQRTVVQRRNRVQYETLAIAAARRHGIDPCLVLGVIQRESAFDAGATGKAGEIGLMQIMDGAADDWVRVTKGRYGARGHLYRPELNIEIGVWYLARAMRDWSAREDREILALAQYNAGPSRAREWAKLDQKNVLSKIPIDSTRQYITVILEYRNQFRERGLCNPK